MSGLGAFASGLSSGINNGMNMAQRANEIKQRKIREKAMKESADEFNRVLKEGMAPVEAAVPANVEYQMPGGLAALPDMDYQNTPEQGQMYAQTPAYADGGLVDVMAMDKNAMVNQPGMRPQQPAQPKQQNRMGMQENLIRAFDAARDKAAQVGDQELAMKYMEMGFKAKDAVYSERKAGAQRAFELSGDIKPLVDIYNQNIPDGYEIKGYSRTPNGYKMSVSDPSGNVTEQEFNPEQIKQMVAYYDNPSVRWANERKAFDDRNKKTFETDEDIRKETAKPRNLGLGDVMVDGTGRQIANNPKPPANDKSMTDIEFYQKDPAGYARFKSAGKKGTGKDGDGAADGKPAKSYNKDQLPVMKELNDTILGYDGMATIDQNTGKAMPTKIGNNAMVFGQRLLKANPDLTPASISRLAAHAATDPKAQDFEVVQRPDGSRYKRPVVVYEGQIYRMSNDGQESIPSEKPKAEPKPSAKPAQTKSQEKPSPKNDKPGLDMVIPPKKEISPQEQYKNFKSAAMPSNLFEMPRTN